MQPSFLAAVALVCMLTAGHWAWVQQETVIQVHGVGPGGLAYVDAADDPRKK